jgi:RecA-family ATPase
LTAQPADLVIIDCFADAYGGDLKDTTKIRFYLNQCRALALKHQCLFLFLHHTGKRSENLEPSKNNLLAGQGFEAKMRCVVELRVDPIRADHRHWCIVKGNYLAADHKQESYVLQFNPSTFTFTDTQERTSMDLLAKRPDDGGRAKYDQAKALQDEGKTLAQIAKIMGYANAGSVSKLLQRYFK